MIHQTITHILQPSPSFLNLAKTVGYGTSCLNLKQLREFSREEFYRELKILADRLQADNEPIQLEWVVAYCLEDLQRVVVQGTLQARACLYAVDATKYSVSLTHLIADKLEDLTPYHPKTAKEL